MEIGTVIGSVWATKKSDKIVGQKFLVVELLRRKNTGSAYLQERTDSSGLCGGELMVAADTIGAGIGDLVLLSRGHAARLLAGEQVPVDASVAGIIDSLDIPG